VNPSADNRCGENAVGSNFFLEVAGIKKREGPGAVMSAPRPKPERFKTLDDISHIGRV
jgi:hypothetical protein